MITITTTMIIITTAAAASLMLLPLTSLLQLILYSNKCTHTHNRHEQTVLKRNLSNGFVVVVVVVVCLFVTEN